MEDKKFSKGSTYILFGIGAVVVICFILAFLVGRNAANQGYSAQEAQKSASASASQSTPAPKGSITTAEPEHDASTATPTRKDGMDDITSGKFEGAEQDLGRFTGVPQKVRNNMKAYSDSFKEVTNLETLIGVKGQNFDPQNCDYTSKHYLVCSSKTKEYAVILNPNNLIPVGVVNLKGEEFTLDQAETFSKVSQHGAQRTFLTGTWSGRYVLLAGDLKGIVFLGA
jgi:hypothetical protein